MDLKHLDAEYIKIKVIGKAQGPRYPKELELFS